MIGLKQIGGSIRITLSLVIQSAEKSYKYACICGEGGHLLHNRVVLTLGKFTREVKLK